MYGKAVSERSPKSAMYELEGSHENSLHDHFRFYFKHVFNLLVLQIICFCIVSGTLGV